jgi:hypothetical protein
MVKENSIQYWFYFTAVTVSMRVSDPLPGHIHRALCLLENMARRLVAVADSSWELLPCNVKNTNTTPRPLA